MAGNLSSSCLSCSTRASKSDVHSHPTRALYSVSRPPLSFETPRILNVSFSFSLPFFLVFRFLGGCAASSPLANAGALMGDIWDQRTRGKAVALFTLAPFAGPALGPVVGGFIGASASASWRYVLSTCLLTPLEKNSHGILSLFSPDLGGSSGFSPFLRAAVWRSSCSLSPKHTLL